MIACKIHERKPPSANDFSYISANSYSSKEIIQMELKVCISLGFHIHDVNPYNFVHHLLRASAASTFSPLITVSERKPYSCRICLIGQSQLTLLFMVQYLLEISFLIYDFVPRKASLTAAAAIYLARVTLGIRDDLLFSSSQNDEGKRSRIGFWSKTLEYYTGYNLIDLEIPVFDLHKAHLASEGYKLKSVFEKYSKEKYNFVALRTVASNKALGFI